MGCSDHQFNHRLSMSCAYTCTLPLSISFQAPQSCQNAETANTFLPTLRCKDPVPFLALRQLQLAQECEVDCKVVLGCLKATSNLEQVDRERDVCKNLHQCLLDSVYLCRCVAPGMPAFNESRSQHFRAHLRFHRRRTPSLLHTLATLNSLKSYHNFCNACTPQAYALMPCLGHVHWNTDASL